MSFEVTRLEWHAFKSDMAPHTRRFWRAVTFRPMTVNTEGGDPAYDRRDRIDHAYMNLFVEAGRARRGDYIMGHVYAVLIPVLIILCLAGCATSDQAPPSETVTASIDGETTSFGSRTCLYMREGIRHSLNVPIADRCPTRAEF